MVQLGSFRHGGQEKGHTIMVQRGPPLAHGGMNRIEDVIGIGWKVELRGDDAGDMECEKQYKGSQKNHRHSRPCHDSRISLPVLLS